MPQGVLAETMKGMLENAERGDHNGGQSPCGDRTERVTDEDRRGHTRLVRGQVQALIRNEVVSSDEESLILVDSNDRELGFLSKSSCHDGAGVLHRAFSLFVLNEAGELLIQ